MKSDWYEKDNDMKSDWYENVNDMKSDWYENVNDIKVIDMKKTIIWKRHWFDSKRWHKQVFADDWSGQIENTENTK